MKQKEYERQFREMFGCEPLTDEEQIFFRACLFHYGNRSANGSAYARYMNDYNRYMEHVQDERNGKFREDEERKMIRELEAKGYKIAK